MSYKVKDLIGKKCVVSVPDVETGKVVEKLFENAGIKIYSSDFSGKAFRSYKKDVCYFFDGGSLSYGDVSYANKTNHKVVTSEEFIKANIELPEKWAIKGPIIKHTDLFNWYRSKIDAAIGGDSDFYYLSDKKEYDLNLKKNYTEITYDQWKLWYDNKDILNKQKDMELTKPKAFLIEGKEHHIKAIEKDLNEIGYRSPSLNHNSGSTVLGLNMSVDGYNNHLCTNDKPKFSEVFICNNAKLYNYSPMTKFMLPGQYSEALKFAKEQIESPWWNTKKSVTKVVGSKDATIEIEKDKILIPHQGNTTLNIEKLNKMRRGTVNAYGIGDYTAVLDKTVRCIRIGCESENNLVSLNEIDEVLKIAESL